MSEQNTTLEQLLYEVRDTIGEIKNRVLDTVTLNGYASSLNTMKSLLKQLQEQGVVMVVDEQKALDIAADNFGMLNRKAVVVDVLSGGPRSYLADTEKKLIALLADIHSDSAIQDSDSGTGANEVLLRLKEHTAHLGVDLRVDQLTEMCDLGKNLYETLEPLARKSRDLDVLTKLYIQPYFQGQLGAEVRHYLRDPTHQFSLVMLDINDFSQYNNFCGHDQADEVLVQTAKILKENVNGIVARRSGDELYMLIPDADQDGALAVTQRLGNIIDKELRERVKQAWKARGKSYNSAFDERCNLTLSFGLTSPYLAEHPNSIIRTYNSLSGNSIDPKYKIILDSLRDVSNAEPSDFDHMLRVLMRDIFDEKQREFLVERVRDNLLYEAELAMHGAKNRKDGVSSTSFVYDPGCPMSEYEYSRESGRTTRLFRKDTFPSAE